jgi:Telomere resolvase
MKVRSTTSLLHLLECDEKDIVREMSLIPIGVVEKTNMQILKQVMARVLSGSQRNLTKKVAMSEWQRLVSEYQMNLRAVVTTDLDDRQVMNDEFMVKIKSEHLDIRKSIIANNVFNLSLASLKNEFTWLRRYLTANPDYPDRDEMFNWTHTQSRTVSLEVNKTSQQNLKKILSDVEDVSQSHIESWVKSKINSSDWRDWTVILAICTGRRMIEILGNESTYTPVDGTHVAFTGQAKKRYGDYIRRVDETVRVIPILFISAEQVCELVQKLDEQGMRIKPLTDKSINKAYSKPLSRHPKPFKQFKDARDIYAALCIHNGLNGRKQDMLYVSEILGHELQANGMSMSAINYRKYNIIE